jgi:hypothetical protein
MLKKILSFSMMAMAVAFFSACSEDEDPIVIVDEVDNHFTLNQETFPLTSGTIHSIDTERHPETNAVVYEWDIMLSSGDQNGKKHWVRFILNSSNPNDVPAGTYTYDEEYKAHAMDDFTYYITSIMRNSVPGTATGDLIANTEFKTGTIVVAKSGSTYSITFNITMDNGDTSTGQFTGPLTLK